MPYRLALLTVVESEWRTWGRPYRLSIRGANQSIEEVAGAAPLLRCQAGCVALSVTASLLCAPDEGAAAAATPSAADRGRVLSETC
jgi:hypothetical protein